MVFQIVGDIMKRKMKVLIIILIISICTGILALNNRKGQVDSLEKNTVTSSNLVGKQYNKAILANAVYDSNIITIYAGYYRFGDYNTDGVIDKTDIDAISQYIEVDYPISLEEKMLLNLNNDDLVDEKDLEIINNFINDKEKYEYVVDKSNILYCVTQDNDYNKCTWQESNSFIIAEVKDYHLFIKEKNSKTISDYLMFYKENIN